jgi:hypothetical protein
LPAAFFFGDVFFRRCSTALRMYASASGVLQDVSPWSTSTGPMRFAAASAS